MRFKKIGREESKAIDQEHVAADACGPDDTRQIERLFDSFPMGGALGTMSFDHLMHLLIVTVLRSGDKRDSVCTFGYLLRVAAFATANSAEDEDDPFAFRLLHVTLLSLR
jgi:hypothetical protein